MTQIVYGDKGGNMIEISRGGDHDTPQGLKEVEELRKMVRAWKEDYARQISPRAGFLYTDFLEEIEENLVPHIQRLMDLNYISLDTRTEILAFAYEKANEIKTMVSAANNDEANIEIGFAD